MIYHEVKSKAISRLGYDRDRQLLEVTFQSGPTLHYYHPVSGREFLSLMRSDSLGKHFHAHIRSADHISYSKGTPPNA